MKRLVFSTILCAITILIQAQIYGPQCADRRQDNYCKKNQNKCKKNSEVKYYCPKTCKLCRSHDYGNNDQNRGCSDLSYVCMYQRNQCYSEQWKQMCPKTCGGCGNNYNNDNDEKEKWGECSSTCGEGIQRRRCKPNEGCRVKTRPCYVDCRSVGQLHVLNDLGCWKENTLPAVPSIEGDPILDGPYQTRNNALQKCAAAANKRGFDIICLHNGGRCGSSHIARYAYMKYGGSTQCPKNGKGGLNSIQCYEIDTVWDPLFTNIGCFADKAPTAIPTMEGTSSQLNGKYQEREDAIRKCARLAASRHVPRTHPVSYFAIQNNGFCSSSTDSLQRYNKYGSTGCLYNNGRGSFNANNVYLIERYRKFRIQSMGCFIDKLDRAIPTAEGSTPDLADTVYYKTREDAIGKCARYAFSRGFSHFAIQDGGWCATSRDAYKQYWKYGSVNTCNNIGTGALGAFQIYRIYNPEQ